MKVFLIEDNQRKGC